MPLRFDNVSCPPLREVSFHLDDGIVAGLVGPDDAGAEVLMRLAARRIEPERGRIEGPEGAVLVEPGPEIHERLASALRASTPILLLHHVLALVDEAARVEVIQQIHQQQRQGVLALIVSHDLPLLERICDVVLALEAGTIVEQGDPGLVLAHYRRRMLNRMAAGSAELAPVARHGDRRAEVQSLEIIGENGASTTIVRSGEMIAIRPKLYFHETVEKPVVGIQIRSRVGVVVYGTNTDLERIEIGPRRRGETLELDFRFRCELCPQEYTLTVASHDPEGTAHDWLEDAVLFSVTDERYTAGVANLRAQVEIR